MMLVTLGVVYGDIGTSPMYTLKAIIEGLVQRDVLDGRRGAQDVETGQGLPVPAAKFTWPKASLRSWKI